MRVLKRRHHGVRRFLRAWVARDLVIVDGELVKKGSKRGGVRLADAKIVSPASTAGAPTAHVLVIDDGRRRFEVCLESADAKEKWRNALTAADRRIQSPVVAEPAKDVPQQKVTKKKTTTKDQRHIVVAVVVAVLAARILGELPVVAAALAWWLSKTQRKSRTTPPTKRTTEETPPVLAVRNKGLRRVDPQASPPPMTWSPASAESFRVRSRGYLETRLKEPSVPAMYAPSLVQVFDATHRIRNITDHIELPEPSAPSPVDDVPSFLVVDAQLPSTVGPLVAGDDADGPGHHIVTVFELTDATRAQLLAAADDASPSAALDLFRRFCRVAPDEAAPGAMRGRFKVIAQVRNIDDVSIPSVAARYNGKPALVSKTGALRRGTTATGHTYLEVAVNVHAFGYLARLGFHSLYHRFRDLVISAAFTIEGRADAELPEAVLGGFDLNFLS